MEPRRVGNPSQTVSRRQETQWSHVEQEPLRKQFPVGKKRSGATSSRNPFANSFLSARNTMESRRAGNPSQAVSCRQETQWSRVEQEPLRKQFPVGKKHSGATSSRKLYAKSFLPVRNTMEPRRAGNPSRIVSCRQETQWSRVEQETLRKQFPVGKKHHSAKSSRETIGEKFPVDKKHHSATPSRKPFANSFLSVRNTIEPRRVGNPSRIVSCR